MMAEINIKNISNGEAVWVLELCKKLGFEVVEMGFDGIVPVCAVGCGKLCEKHKNTKQGCAESGQEIENRAKGFEKKGGRVERFIENNRKKV